MLGLLSHPNCVKKHSTVMEYELESVDLYYVKELKISQITHE